MIIDFTSGGRRNLPESTRKELLDLVRKGRSQIGNERLAWATRWKERLAQAKELPVGIQKVRRDIDDLILGRKVF
jgi:hypothetical protein